jgi:putative FmdB family regulatory protein
MPIYEYKCQSCENELEKLQRISDPPLTDCPACNEPALKRLISAAGFRLKGAGWYETDFKKGSKRNLHDSGDSKSSDSGDSKSSDSGDGKSSDSGSSKSSDSGSSKSSGTKAAESDSKTPAKSSEASKPSSSTAGKKSDAA